METRLRVCEQVVDHSVPATEVSAVFRVPVTTIYQWTRLYRALGREAFMARDARPATPEPRSVGHAESVRRDAVVQKRESNPTWGTRRIRDVLERFEGVGVSETEVRRILHEAGLIEDTAPPPAREHGPRRFERAEPNQLWQSDSRLVRGRDRRRCARRRWRGTRASRRLGCRWCWSSRRRRVGELLPIRLY